MNTFIISSKNYNLALEQVDKINKEQKIDKFDIEIAEFEKTLGIEDVRNIQKKIFLKPRISTKKSTILVLLEGATIDAQNSMLKLLEEPPISCLIFLITDNYQIFLPTILSRVKLIEINENRTIDGRGLNQILNINDAGDSLYLAQEVSKDKTGATLWLENAILAARELMINNLDDKTQALKLRKLIHKLELTHYDLKSTNVNPRLALENLFLNI